MVASAVKFNIRDETKLVSILIKSIFCGVTSASMVTPFNLPVFSAGEYSFSSPSKNFHFIYCILFRFGCCRGYMVLVCVKECLSLDMEVTVYESTHWLVMILH
jgi:hypothetical protein